MLCSRRGRHPMDCRIACDLSAVQYHRIYRKLSGDMLGACASAMLVSDCPHGQEKRIIQRKLSPKMPPHGAFQPNPIVEATVKKSFRGFGSLCGRSTSGSIINQGSAASGCAAPRATRGTRAAPLGRRMAPVPGQAHQKRRCEKSTSFKRDNRDNRITDL